MISLLSFPAPRLLLSGDCLPISHFPQILVSGSASGEPNSTWHRLSTFYAFFPPIFKTMARDQYQTFPQFTDGETGSETPGVLHTAVPGEPGFRPKFDPMLAIMLHHAVHPTSLHLPPTAESQTRFILESGPWRHGAWRECARDGEEAGMRACSAGLHSGAWSHVEPSQNCSEGRVFLHQLCPMLLKGPQRCQLFPTPRVTKGFAGAPPPAQPCQRNPRAECERGALMDTGSEWLAQQQLQYREAMRLSGRAQRTSRHTSFPASCNQCLLIRTHIC